jgi:hypothetical protein
MSTFDNTFYERFCNFFRGSPSSGDYAGGGGGGLDSPRLGKMRENAQHNTSALNQGEQHRADNRNAM